MPTDPAEPRSSLPERDGETDEGQRPQENSTQIATMPFTAIAQNVFIPPARVPSRDADRPSGRNRANVRGGDRSIISYSDWNEPRRKLPERNGAAIDGQGPREKSTQVVTMPFTAAPRNMSMPTARGPLRDANRPSGRTCSRVCGVDRTIISYGDLDETWQSPPEKDGEAEGQRPRGRSTVPFTAIPQSMSIPPARGPQGEAKMRRNRKYHDLDLCTD